MAVINKIREKSLLLLIVIGGAMIAFILGDVLSSGGSMFSRDMHVAEIEGEEISAIEFENRVQKAIQEYEIQSEEPINEAVRQELREKAWNDMISEYVLEAQIAKAGLSLSSEELFDMVQGRDPHPQVKQAFSNPETGEFDPSNVIRFLKNMENDQTGKTKAQWLLFEKGIKKQRLIKKYNTLISEGIYVTGAEAKRQFTATNKNFDIEYVVRRYSSLSDAEVNLTKEDIKSYYGEHKEEYRQDASRKIQYVLFNIEPSEDDHAEAKAWIEEVHKEFKNTDDDSMYVNLNSDVPIDLKWYAKGELSPRLDTAFFSEKAEKGDMVGPYLDEMTYKTSKLWQVDHFPDSVLAKHILLKDPRQQNQQQPMPVDSSIWKVADSLKTAIENGADFGAIAMEFSQDPGSARDSGRLGWFQQGQMVKVFNDAAFSADIGDMPIVESQFGLHIIKLEDKSEEVKKIRVATVEREILPSRETYDNVFNQASQFSIDNNTADAFVASVEEQGLVSRVAEVEENDKSIPGLQDSREVISWAYESEEGSVSPPISLSGKFIVAMVDEVREEGIAPLDQVRTEVELAAMKKKKASVFKEQMSGITNLQKLADKVGTKVEKAEAINFNSFSVPGMGREPAVIGKVVTLEEGQVSVPIKGNTGVFVVKVTKVIPPPKVDNYTKARQQLNQEYASRVNLEVFEALKESADIVDRRAKFY